MQNNFPIPYQTSNVNQRQTFNQPNNVSQMNPINRLSVQNSLNNSNIFRGAINYSQPQTNTYPLAEQEYYGNNNKSGLLENARRSFIIKVYGLLTLQLILTTIIGYIGYNNPLFNQFIIQIPVIIIASVGLLVVSLIIGCCTDVFRRYALPLFTIFTLLMALLVAISICGFKSKVILVAAGITLLLVFALTVFACTTSFDITGCGVYLMLMGLVMLVFGIVVIFWRDPIVQLIYSCLGAFLFGIYLVYDTQLVLGKHQYSYTLDDAYLAALQLYIDIIDLFLNILQIVGFISN